MLSVVLFLKAQRETKTDFGVSKSELENQISFCFAFLLMNFSNYIMGNKRHLPFPSSTLCVVDRSNQYRPHVVSMGYRCDTAVSDKYKNAGKQTIFWQFLNLRGQICIFELVTLRQKWSLTSVCVLFILAPFGALLSSISQHFTSYISPNTSNIS